MRSPGLPHPLGEAGATVVCAGRTSVPGEQVSRTTTVLRPSRNTAELVTQLGGIGIAMQVDQLGPAQIRALVERIRYDLGHIDGLGTLSGAARSARDAPLTGTLQFGSQRRPTVRGYD